MEVVRGNVRGTIRLGERLVLDGVNRREIGRSSVIDGAQEMTGGVVLAVLVEISRTPRTVPRVSVDTIIMSLTLLLVTLLMGMVGICRQTAQRQRMQ